MMECNGIKWHHYHGALVPDVAPHIAHNPTGQDQKFLLKKSKAYFLRWHSSFDTKQETAFWHVIKSAPCNLQELSKNTRNQVRKGLKNCTIRRVCPSQLAEAGYEVYRKAMESYETDLRIMEKIEFQNILKEMALLKDYEFWGAWDLEDHLVAYAQNKIQDHSCNYQVIKLDPKYLKLYAGYALIYSMNLHYLNERKVLYVNDGAKSIRHDTGVQNFLIQKFRFRKAYSHLHVSYVPLIGIAIRILYPFRSIIEQIPISLTRKISVLLYQEEICRSYVD